jgi:hypothetical protein
LKSYFFEVNDPHYKLIIIYNDSANNIINANDSASQFLLNFIENRAHQSKVLTDRTYFKYNYLQNQISAMDHVKQKLLAFKTQLHDTRIECLKKRNILDLKKKFLFDNTTHELKELS